LRESGDNGAQGLHLARLAARDRGQPRREGDPAHQFAAGVSIRDVERPAGPVRAAASSSGDAAVMRARGGSRSAWHLLLGLPALLASYPALAQSGGASGDDTGGVDADNASDGYTPAEGSASPPAFHVN